MKKDTDEENKEDSRGRGLAKLKQRATQQVPAARRSVVSADTAATEKGIEHPHCLIHSECNVKKYLVYEV